MNETGGWQGGMGCRVGKLFLNGRGR